MAKAPVAGRVKTRLAQEIGTIAATWLYRHMAAAVLARLCSAGGRWPTVIALSPDSARRPAGWPRSAAIERQGRGDLGARMQAALERQPPGPVVLIGTDIPAIRPRHIAAAFRALQAHDAVFGPAADGGYWLVGLKRLPRCPRPFSGVRWSGPEALSDTLRNLARYKVARVDALSDVDTGAEARRVAAWCGRRVLPAGV